MTSRAILLPSPGKHDALEFIGLNNNGSADFSLKVSQEDCFRLGIKNIYAHWA